MPSYSLDRFRQWDKGFRASPRKARTKKILFDVPNAFSAKAVLPVAMELMQRGYMVKLTGRDQQPESEWSYLPFYPDLRKHFIHRYLARWRPWDIIVFTDGPSAEYIRWALKVRFPHGPGEGLYGSPHSLALVKSWGYNVLLCTSESNVRHIENLNPAFIAEQNLFSIGWPCLDDLAKGLFNRNRILQDLDLPADRKTVLITSHWTPASFLRMLGGAKVVECLGNLTGINLILTAHNHLWFRQSVRKELGEAWYHELDNAVRSNINMRMIRTGDIRPLLSVADLMIGDRSSVTQEYSVLNRPIIQFLQQDHAPSDHGLDDLFSQTTHRFSSLEQMVMIVESQLQSPFIGEEGVRESFVKRSFSHLGMATKRAADIIEKLARD